MNATYLELSVESHRNCKDVYRQIIEQIIDAKYAYEQSIHSDIKVFLIHDTKQISVYIFLHIIKKRVLQKLRTNFKNSQR